MIYNLILQWRLEEELGLPPSPSHLLLSAWWLGGKRLRLMPRREGETREGRRLSSVPTSSSPSLYEGGGGGERRGKFWGRQPNYSNLRRGRTHLPPHTFSPLWGQAAQTVMAGGGGGGRHGSSIGQ